MTVLNLELRVNSVFGSADPPDMAAAVGRLILLYVHEQARLGHLRGESPRTVRYRLCMFADFVGPQLPVTSVTRRRVERWLLAMDVNDATRRVRLSAVKTFLSWCVLHGHLRSNPAATIEPPRQPHLLPARALTTEQVAAIYRSCPNVRAELIVTLMVQEGLRAGGVASLQLGDVDLAQRMLCVTEKGGDERALPITAETARVLCRYLAETKVDAGPLVRSLVEPRKGILPATVSRVVARVMADAGVDETGHALRHTCASDMLERGVNVRTVQYVLGHHSLATTQRYLRRFVGDLREAMEGRSYRP